MNPQSLLVAAGLLLVLAGLFGGGFEIQQIKIPKLGSTVRIICCSFGIAFVLLAISMRTDGRSNSQQAPNDQARNEGPNQIQFVIFDSLSPELIAAGQSEQASIRIDGKAVGTLTVNEHFPSSTLTVTVQSKGQHSFAIQASAVIPNNEQLIKVGCYGTGMIEVRERSRFSFEARYDENGPCLGWLEEH